MKRILSSIMAAIICCSLLSLFGCGGLGGVGIDSGKTQIYVSNYNGGYGDEWLQNLKKKFEEQYVDYKLNDKIGVQVIINNHKSPATELNSLSGSKNEIFYLSADYYKEVSRDLFMNISDIVKEKDENGISIEDRLTKSQQDYFKSYKGDYYALPREEGVFGFVYDVDFFNENNLFFAKNGCPTESGYKGAYRLTNENGDRATGPDGEYGTYDDGLPATYDDLFYLFDQMNKGGIIPITWTGWYYDSYLSWLLMAIATDYEGVENLQTYYDLNGKLSTYVSNITDDGSLFGNVQTKEENVDTRSGYKLFETAGRYYALKVLEKIISNDNYYDTVNCFKSTVSHTDAQYNFLDSEQKTALIPEGSWWENEAEASFEMLDRDIKESRFAIMPMPKVSKEHFGKATYCELMTTIAFIKKDVDPDKIPLIKEFYKFSYSQENLQEYTMLTNTSMALAYDLKQEQYDSLSYFGKSVWNIHNKERGNIVYQCSSNISFLSNYNALSYKNTFYSKVDNAIVKNPIDSYRQKKTSALEYFNNLKAYYQTEWPNYIK